MDCREPNIHVFPSQPRHQNVQTNSVNTMREISSQQKSPSNHCQEQPTPNTKHATQHIEDVSRQRATPEWNDLPLVILCNVFYNLSSTDRLSASSACHNWRNVIYHSSLWPQKHLKVNLCPHKFTIPSTKNELISSDKSGFHTFTLRDPEFYCGSNAPKRKENQYYRRPNKHNFNQHLKSFLQKCCRFLNGLTIYFDPNSSYNVIDLIKILKHMSTNEIAIYELSNNSTCSYIYANCRNLKSFSLVPVTPLVRSAFSERFIYLYYGLTDAIRFLFSKCQFLERISLGDLHELVYSTEDYLEQFLKSGHQQSLRFLHLSSIKGDVFRYISHTVSFDGFEKFVALQYLSIDFDVLDTNAIFIFCRLYSLQKLTINVHRINRYHPGIKKEAWTGLVQALPSLRVTCNLLHTESSHFGTVYESFLNTDVPLQTFRAYYLEFKDELAQSLMCNLLETLALRHSKTLTSVAIIDRLDRPKRYLKSNSPNALVMFTWRCRHLQDLSIIGFELTDIDLIAIARLRGPALRNFHFPASCIQLTKSFCANAVVEDYYFYNHYTNFDFAPFAVQKAFNNFVSVPLDRPWQPIATFEIPENTLSDYIPQMTYHRTLIEQFNSLV